MTSKNRTPRHGEIWLVNFEPQVGREIRKTRPAVVLSSDAMEILPLRIVAPIREHRPVHDNRPFLVSVAPARSNGLSKMSSIDVAQLHSFDLARFVKRIGRLADDDVAHVKGACSMVLDLH